MIGHLLRHDQRVFGVDGRLHVVSGNYAVGGAHKTGFWLWVPAQLLERAGHRAGVDDHFILLIGLFQLFQVAF
jgi:hypothetical protein